MNENNQLAFLRSIAGSSITNHDFGDDLTTFHIIIHFVIFKI